MRYRALLIGNSIFESDASLNPLNAPVKDVARLHHALVDPATGLFDEGNVRLVTERTCDRILDEIDTFFDDAQRDDLSVLYYSGHGLLDERNQLFLCGRDTRSDRLLRTGVSNTRINEFITQSRCQRTVILLDCCSSGQFKGGDVGTQLAGPGKFIVSSTRGTALANDAALPTGTSLFTEYLVEGLLGGAPDIDGDGFIDLREVYDFVRDRLRASTTQVPHCRFDGDAAVSLARVRDLPRLSRSPGAASGAPPSFALAENAITLHDVAPNEVLPPEVVEILALGDRPLDLTVRSEHDWVDARVTNAQLVVGLRPRPGVNRAKVVVHDRNSGTSAVLRLTVQVLSPPSAPSAPTARAPVAPPPRQPAWQQDAPDSTLQFRPIVVPPPAPATKGPAASQPDAAQRERRSTPIGAPPGPARPTRPRRRAVAGAIAAACTVVVGAAVAVVISRAGDRSTPSPFPPSPGPTATTHSAPPSRPISHVLPPPQPGAARYSAPGGISVTGPAGWIEDDSAGTVNIRDYVPPGTTDIHTATTFRIGIGNPSPKADMAAEQADAVDFQLNRGTNTDTTIVRSDAGTFLGVPSADIELTATSRFGVARHVLERIWISSGSTKIIQVSTDADQWDPSLTLFNQLARDCTVT